MSWGLPAPRSQDTFCSTPMIHRTNFRANVLHSEDKKRGDLRDNVWSSPDAIWGEKLPKAEILMQHSLLTACKTDKVTCGDSACPRKWRIRPARSLPLSSLTKRCSPRSVTSSLLFVRNIKRRICERKVHKSEQVAWISS